MGFHQGARTSGSTYYYLEAPDGAEVLDWFRSLPQPADEYPKDGGLLLHFRAYGGLVSGGSGGFDVSGSPLVSVFPPTVRRKVLWTVGEIHFLTKDLRTRYPDLDALRRRFQRWLETHQLVWERRRDGEEGYSHFLEGGIKNVAERVYALPSGLAAYEDRQYFVGHGEADVTLDRVCKTLRLRGIG
jgi:hypothetical protein